MFWARMSYRELSLSQEPAIMQETQALRQGLFVFMDVGWSLGAGLPAIDGSELGYL